VPVLLGPHARYLFQDYKTDTPMANLLVTVLDSVGVPVAKLGDSTGQLLLDYARA
jgi:hypothetical protein